MIQTGEQPLFIPLEQITETGAIDGDDPDRTGLFCRSEKAVSPFQQLTQNQLQTATHGTYHIRGKIRIEKILEIGQTIFGRHGKKPFRIFRFPREIGSNVIGRNREREHPATPVTCRHHFDIGTV